MQVRSAVQNFMQLYIYLFRPAVAHANILWLIRSILLIVQIYLSRAKAKWQLKVQLKKVMFVLF